MQELSCCHCQPLVPELYFWGRVRVGTAALSPSQPSLGTAKRRASEDHPMKLLAIWGQGLPTKNKSPGAGEAEGRGQGCIAAFVCGCGGAAGQGILVLRTP